MLDLNHPMTKHIFAASSMEDFLLGSAHRMTLLPSDKRLLLLDECAVVLEKMRRLNQEHFEASPFIFCVIDEAQAALETIAHLGNGSVREDRTDGDGNCAVCDTPIIKLRDPPAIMFCPHCEEPFIEAKTKLESPEGFGTCFI